MIRFRSLKLAGTIVAAVSAWPIGYWIQETYLSAPLIVGGSICETAVVDNQEIASCFGYPPAGAMILAMLLAVLVNTVFTGVERGFEVVE